MSCPDHERLLTPLPPFRTWNLPETTINHALVGNLFMLGAGGIVVVALSAYFGRLPILFWFSILALVTAAWSAAAKSFESFEAARILHGFFSTVAQSVCTHRSSVCGILHYLIGKLIRVWLGRTDVYQRYLLLPRASVSLDTSVPHSNQSRLTINQTQNQHLVLLHCPVALPRPLCRFLHHLEDEVAMGVLDHHDTLGCRPDPHRGLHG
jgi:hypothetical protein